MVSKFFIDGFNETCKNMSTRSMNVRDDTMSKIGFLTTAIGDLPHLSYIFRKPEPLGTEFNTFEFSVTGDFLFVEAQRGK